MCTAQVRMHRNALPMGGRHAGSAFYAADKQEKRAEKGNKCNIILYVVSKATIDK